MYIVGLKIIKCVKNTHIGETESGHPIYKELEYTKHVLAAVSDFGDKIEIHLSLKKGLCYSGYTTATWAKIEFKEVLCFKGLTHFPIKRLYLDDVINRHVQNKINNEVFSFSKNGYDEYYPCGSYKVNMELFIERDFPENRKIYIFSKSSNIDRNSLPEHLKGLSVYETDSNDKLPALITEDIVILGDKYQFESYEIIERLLFNEPDIINNCLLDL